MATQSIAVASVDAPRRRDEVLPEHEARWPATERVRALIEDRYDGTAGNAHEIGLTLVTVKDGCYPGWRIQQIAETMGMGRGMGQQPQKPQETRTGAICAECGKTFTFWRMYKGRVAQTKFCHDCFVASHKGTPAPQQPAPETQPEPTAAAVAEPVFVAGRNFPDLAALTAPLPDGPESFGDLPGSDVVFGLLDLLPVSGRWTPKRRVQWRDALMATLDLLIEESAEEVAR